MRPALSARWLRWPTSLTPAAQNRFGRHARRRRPGRAGTPVRRAAVRHPPGSVHTARRAGGVSRGVRGAAGPAAVPDPQAEFQHPGHSDGRRDPPVPGLRGRNPRAQPGTGGRIPADGGDADRDQVAHAAAAAQGGRRPGSRRPARRTGAAPAGIRADQAGRGGTQHGSAVLGRDFLRVQVTIEQSLQPRFPGCRPDRSAAGLARHPARAPSWCNTTISRANSCRCANTWASCCGACRASVSSSSRTCSTRPGARRCWSSPSSPCSNWPRKTWSTSHRPSRSRRSTCAWPTAWHRAPSSTGAQSAYASAPRHAAQAASQASSRASRAINAATACVGSSRPSSKASTAQAIGMSTPSDCARCTTVRAQ